MSEIKNKIEELNIDDITSMVDKLILINKINEIISE